MNNLEVIAKMANLRLKAEVFQLMDGMVINPDNRYEGNNLSLREDIEKKMYILTLTGVFAKAYSNQEAVDLLIHFYSSENASGE